MFKSYSQSISYMDYCGYYIHLLWISYMDIVMDILISKMYTLVIKIFKDYF